MKGFEMGRVDRVKKIVRLVVFFDIAILAVYFWLNGFNFLEVLTKTTIIIGVSIGIVYLINKFLWKFKFFNFVFDSPPDINGKWKGEIVNTKDNMSQKMEMEIKQTYLETYITVKAERGNSTTWVGDIVKVNGNDWKVMWTWHANYLGQEFSGTTILDIISENTLEGYYYTNANVDGRGCTSGSFKAKKVE